jgi:hypothetical protein
MTAAFTSFDLPLQRSQQHHRKNQQHQCERPSQVQNGCKLARSENLIAIAGPVPVKVNTGNHDDTPAGGCKDNPQVLPVGTVIFQRVFRVGISPHITFTIVDPAFPQNLHYFLPADLAAVHPATGMAAENKLSGITDKTRC